VRSTPVAFSPYTARPSPTAAKAGVPAHTSTSAHVTANILTTGARWRILEHAMSIRRYKVILEPEPSGGFSVYVPSLPGCASQGETEEEALTNIREAVALYLSSLREDGLEIPNDDVILTEVEVAA